MSSSSGNNKNSVLQRNSRYNQSPEKEKRKYHQERTLSQLLRYNTPNYKKENNEYNNSSSNKDNDSNEMKKSNTRYGRMRGISTSGVRINRNKTDVNGVSGFKLNVDNITAEDKVYPKSPNKNRRGMNINNIKSDLGLKDPCQGKFSITQFFSGNNNYFVYFDDSIRADKDTAFVLHLETPVRT